MCKRASPWARAPENAHMPNTRMKAAATARADPFNESEELRHAPGRAVMLLTASGFVACRRRRRSGRSCALLRLMPLLHGRLSCR